MSFRKICVLLLDNSGMTLSGLIAQECPDIQVIVATDNSEEVFKCTTWPVFLSLHEQGVKDFIKNCNKKRLIFTNDCSLAIKAAEVIFIVSQPEMMARGVGKNGLLDLSKIDEAALLIAEHADSDKIVVERSSMPLKATEWIKNVLIRNSKPGVHFQVVSCSEIYPPGSPFRNIALPDCLLIGRENTDEGIAATKKISGIFERWMPSKNIISHSNRTAELSRLCTSVMIAQMLTSARVVFLLCEETGARVPDLFSILPEHNYNLLCSLGHAFRPAQFFKDLRNLIYLYKWHGLTESVDYWGAALEICNFTKQTFFEKFSMRLGILYGKKIAILGFGSVRATEVTLGFTTIDVCKTFIEEGALISVYDPKVSQKQVIAALMSAGCNVSEETLKTSITVSKEPYKAMCQCQVIITCELCPQFDEVNYRRVYAKMAKPAYIFDRGHNLPHKRLSKIGFIVQTFGFFIDY